MILLPKYRELVVPVALKRPVFKGHFILEAMGLDGRIRKLAEFDNLITTNGANLLGNGTPLIYCSVGTGNTPPTLADTSLQSFVSSTSTLNFSTGTAQSSSPYYGTTTRQYAFPIGGATGNLAEVGIGSSGSNTSLFSRALILDGMGNPTTITVLSSEALYVTYVLNQYVPLVDVTGTVTINAVVYNYRVRAADCTTAGLWALRSPDQPQIARAQVFNGVIGAITSSPSGASADASSIANDAYSVGSFTSSGTATYDLGNANLAGGVSACLVNFGSNFETRGEYQIGISPSIPKDSSHVLTLSFSTSWAINSP